MSADDAVPKIARNEMFYFIARICMMASLPLGGWFGTRIVNQADVLQTAVMQQNIDIRVLQTTIKDKLDAHVNQLSDHELRIRQLERK